MLNFDKEYNEAQTSGYPYDFLSVMCTTCGVELAHTQTEIEALPNGTELLGVYPENDIETWRDFCTICRRRLAALPRSTGKESCSLCSIRQANGNGKQHPPLFLQLFGFRDPLYSDKLTNKRTGRRNTLLDPDDGLTMNLEVNYLLPVRSWRKRGSESSQRF